MALDPTIIGTQLEASTLAVDAGRLRFFAKAIGETDPVYVDIDAAHRAGHHDLPVPPTFLFGIELESPDAFAWLADIGVDLRRVLHGTQGFTYNSVAHAGDTLVSRPRITDVYAKRGGALEFIVKQSDISRSDGSAVATLTNTIVIQHPDVDA